MEITTDLLRAGSFRSAGSRIGDLDVDFREAGLPLQLAERGIGLPTSCTNWSHHWLALWATFAARDPLSIDGALLVRATLCFVAGIDSCTRAEIKSNFRRMSPPVA